MVWRVYVYVYVYVYFFVMFSFFSVNALQTNHQVYTINYNIYMEQFVATGVNWVNGTWKRCIFEVAFCWDAKIKNEQMKKANKNREKKKKHELGGNLKLFNGTHNDV